MINVVSYDSGHTHPSKSRRYTALAINASDLGTPYKNSKTIFKLYFFRRKWVYFALNIAYGRKLSYSPLTRVHLLTLFVCDLRIVAYEIENNIIN